MPHLLETAIEATAETDAAILEAIVTQLALQMPSVGFSLDLESGQLRLKASNEEDLEKAVNRITRSVQVRVGAPQVGYREAPSCAAEIDYTHKRSNGLRGEFARVKLRIEPAEGMEVSFAASVERGAIPDKFIPGVEAGVRAVARSGSLVGFPMIKTRVTLLDGACHDVDSSIVTFEVATRVAMRKGAEQAGMQVFEPFMRLSIAYPDDDDDARGRVIGELNSRRGEITAQKLDGEVIHIEALAPLANLFGCRKTLAEMTSGRATLSMDFDHYRPLPNQPPDDVFPPAVGMRA